MGNDAYWFDHDYNARNDDKVLELRSEFGAEGYGVYWMIIETMAENANGGIKATLLGGLSLGYGVAKDKLLAIIQFCYSINLFYEDCGVVFSRRLIEHKIKRKTLSENGSKGATIRWENERKNRVANGGAIATPMHKREEENIIQYTTDKIPYNAKTQEDMVVLEMVKIFKEFNQGYYFDKDSDYPACLQLAYKLADMKGIKRSDVLDVKEQDILQSWRKIVEFIRTDDWLRTRSLSDIAGKEFQRLVQKMNEKKNDIKKEATQPKIKLN